MDTSIFVDDEFIANDNSAPVPNFEDDEPKDDAGRDECDETSRSSFDACFFNGLLEGVKGAESRFAHCPVEEDSRRGGCETSGFAVAVLDRLVETKISSRLISTSQA